MTRNQPLSPPISNCICKNNDFMPQRITLAIDSLGDHVIQSDNRRLTYFNTRFLVRTQGG